MWEPRKSLLLTRCFPLGPAARRAGPKVNQRTYLGLRPALQDAHVIFNHERHAHGVKPATNKGASLCYGLCLAPKPDAPSPLWTASYTALLATSPGSCSRERAGKTQISCKKRDFLARNVLSPILSVIRINFINKTVHFILKITQDDWTDDH